jgi:hypothetical protein
MRKLVFLVSALVFTLSVAGQDFSTEMTSLEPNSPECAFGLRYDSGSGTLPMFSSANDWILAQKFELPNGTTGLRQACIRFVRVGTTPFPFDLMFFDDNGINGTPGTVLKTISVTGDFPGTTGYVTVDLINAGVNLPDSTIYVGVRRDGSTVGVTGEGGSPVATMAFSNLNGASGSWNYVTNFKAASIRLDPIPECLSSSTVLCLNTYFRVEATFTSGGTTGTAKVVRLTNETGYLWFFSSTNVEAVVKVLDGCGVNNAHWVYAGGLTDQAMTLTVTDVRSGAYKSYTNPAGTPFQPIQDVNALPGTCP